MKILVIDDKEINRKAAVAQLGKDHDLTVKASFWEAEKDLVMMECDHEVPSYDAILTDLMIKDDQIAGKDAARFVGEEMPAGIAIVMLAAALGTEHVGLLSDGTTHCHPFNRYLSRVMRTAYCAKYKKLESENRLDELSLYRGKIEICGVQVFMSADGSQGFVGHFDPEDLSQLRDWNSPGVDAKNWKKLLEAMVGQK